MIKQLIIDILLVLGIIAGIVTTVMFDVWTGIPLGGIFILPTAYLAVKFFERRGWLSGLL